MSVSNLTGTKWVINDSPNHIGWTVEYRINFTSNSTTYVSLGCRYYSLYTSQLDYYNTYGEGDGTTVYYDDNGTEVWTDNAYKTIEITGGDDATNSDLIAWLEANATQLSTTPTLTFSGDLSSYLTVKVNNVTVSSGYELSHGDKVELFLDDNYPDYEILINGEEITDSEITVLNEDINIEVNEAVTVLPYLTFSSPNTFTLEIVDHTKYRNGTLEYSTDAENWSTRGGTTVPVLSSTQSGATKYLYIRGSNNTYITGSSASSTKGRWLLTGSDISCDGNIETLLDYQTVANGNHPNMATYCFGNLFRNNANLIKAPDLPATTLTEYCYWYMFIGCTSLVTAPELPAVTLAKDCYASMFNNCTSLTTAPSLPATTLADGCYSSMFSRCTSLTSAPALPATTLADTCYYYMFSRCTSLTAPAIMAGGTTQAIAAKHCCSYMYYGCTSLNIHTFSSGYTAFYKAITYSTDVAATNYQSSYKMFYNCKISGSTSTDDYLTAGTQYYY